MDCYLVCHTLRKKKELAPISAPYFETVDQFLVYSLWINYATLLRLVENRLLYSLRINSKFVLSQTGK